jgi:hypothetical protein
MLFSINTKQTWLDSYMPCVAMAHSTKLWIWWWKANSLPVVPVISEWTWATFNRSCVTYLILSYHHCLHIISLLPSKKGGGEEGSYHISCRHPRMSETPVMVYYISIEDGKTLGCYNKFCKNYQNWMGLNDICIWHMVHFQDPFLM